MADPAQPRLEVSTVAEWHDWLAQHHETAAGVWLIFWRSGREPDAPIDYDAAVREALCWGWIDGHTKRFDDGRALQWFTRRGRTSAWAASNKARVGELIAAGRMQPAGQAVIDDAKARGLWNLLDDAEALIESPDLAAALDAMPQARAHWDAFPPSARKFALSQLAFAKRPDTKARRIATIVAQAARGERPA